MRLIEQERDGCVYASVAMLLSIDKSAAYHLLCSHWKVEDFKPFAEPFQDVPRVPSMEEICDALIRYNSGIALVPFPRNPLATPHQECPPIQVWANPEEKFRQQLSRGRGLIEGIVGDRGHMVAWDGSIVYDPRGYCYSINVSDKFNFVPRRFWLAVGK